MNSNDPTPRLEDFQGALPDDFVERLRRDAERLRDERRQADADDRTAVVEARRAFLTHVEDE